MCDDDMMEQKYDHPTGSLVDRVGWFAFARGQITVRDSGAVYRWMGRGEVVFEQCREGGVAPIGREYLPKKFFGAGGEGE